MNKVAGMFVMALLATEIEVRLAQVLGPRMDDNGVVNACILTDVSTMRRRFGNLRATVLGKIWITDPDKAVATNATTSLLPMPWRCIPPGIAISSSFIMRWLFNVQVYSWLTTWNAHVAPSAWLRWHITRRTETKATFTSIFSS